MYKDDTILVVGQAKPSKEDAIYSLHGEFYVSFVVERATGKILDLECNTILSVTRNFVVSMLLGKSLKTDLDAEYPGKVFCTDSEAAHCLSEGRT